MHLLRLAAAGALHVDDRACTALRQAREPGTMAAGLDEDFVALLNERLHQRIDVRLEHRLAAGQLDQLAVEPGHFGDDGLDGHLVAFGEGIRRVAPRAAQIARREADEDARAPDVRGLALNRQVDLVDRQHGRARLFCHLRCDDRHGPDSALSSMPGSPDASPAGAIRIGTSGWSYPSGKGTWNGIFYPTPRPRGFDELAFYAEHFDTVEVNSTFYRSPRRRRRRSG